MNIYMKKLFIVVLSILLVACSNTTQKLQETNKEEINGVNKEEVVEKEESVKVENTDEKEDKQEELHEVKNEDVVVELSDSQKNSIAMLSYLAFLSQEVNSTQNSRMFLEEAYASLINNTNPEKVNELTQSHLSSLLDIIEEYRMISVKRERLEYLYNQNKALAIKKAMPDPIALLSATNAKGLKQLAASIIYMAVDSYNSYKEYNSELDNEFLKDNWELDDVAASKIHDSKTRAFGFMVDTVQEFNFPGKLTLNEHSINDFVKYKKNKNVAQKIQFFESELNTYATFGNYWLELVDCYYQNKDYEKCIHAITQYENLDIQIFRKDYYLAKSLPNVIIAGFQLYPLKEYIPFAEKYVKLLLDNTENSEWSLKMFAAQVYMNLYGRTKEEGFLKEAYSILLNNVNYLVNEQMENNNQYLKEVKKVEVPNGASREEKKQIKAYNKAMKEQRSVELPPIYEPLKLNCELLFFVANQLDLPQEEKDKIDGILNDSSEKVFLCEQVENRFSFKKVKPDIKASFNKGSLTLPVSCLSQDSIVNVKLINGKETILVEKLNVKKVERKGNKIKDFKANYFHNDFKDVDWTDGMIVHVEICESEDVKDNPIILKFKGKQKKFLGVFKKIEFVQVK